MVLPPAGSGPPAPRARRPRKAAKASPSPLPDSAPDSGLPARLAASVDAVASWEVVRDSGENHLRPGEELPGLEAVLRLRREGPEPVAATASGAPEPPPARAAPDPPAAQAPALTPPSSPAPQPPRRAVHVPVATPAAKAATTVEVAVERLWDQLEQLEAEAEACERERLLLQARLARVEALSRQLDGLPRLLALARQAIGPGPR